MLRRVLPIVLVLFLAPPLPGRATTMIAFDLPTLVSRAQVVAVVDVTGLTVQRTAGRLTTVATLQVARAVKGAQLGDTLTAWVPGGIEGDWVQEVEGAPQLSVGESCVVFLQPTGAGTFRFLGLEQGRLTIAADALAPGGWSIRRTFHAHLVGPAPALPAQEPLLPLLDTLDRLARSGR